MSFINAKALRWSFIRIGDGHVWWIPQRQVSRASHLSGAGRRVNSPIHCLSVFLSPLALKYSLIRSLILSFVPSYDISSAKAISSTSALFLLPRVPVKIVRWLSHARLIRLSLAAVLFAVSLSVSFLFFSDQPFCSSLLMPSL